MSNDPAFHVGPTHHDGRVVFTVRGADLADLEAQAQEMLDLFMGEYPVTWSMDVEDLGLKVGTQQDPAIRYIRDWHGTVTARWTSP